MIKITFPILLFLSSGLFAQNHTHVNVLSKNNFNHKTDSILNIALALVDSVINTTTFRERISHAYFVNTKNLSNVEILTLLTSGKEVFNRTPNDTMDLNLGIYPDQRGDNIGTTYNSRNIISSESWLLRNGARCYAAHIIHEYCHTIGNGTIGFEHRTRVYSKKQRREKCFSVPYIIGDIARQILGTRTCGFECENYDN